MLISRDSRGWSSRAFNALPPSRTLDSSSRPRERDANLPDADERVNSTAGH